MCAASRSSLALVLLLLLWAGCEALPPTCTSRVQECHATGTAVYEVTFHGDWVTPRPPENAFFSPLIGMSHSACASLWTPGSLASTGVQEVAENGTTTYIRNEIVSYGRQSLHLIEGSRLDLVEIGTVVTNVTVDAFHPLVSLLTKISPSPDWFTGVNDVSLCTATDQWMASLDVDTVIWDAGTDSALNFTSERNMTSPPQYIEALTPASNRSIVFPDTTSVNPVLVGRVSFRLMTIYEDQPAQNPNCQTCNRTGDRPGAHMCSCEEQCTARGQAVYYMTISSNWLTPTPPSGAMFGPFTAVSHSQCSVLWRNLVYATQGVQAVAETGNRTHLLPEITALGDHIGVTLSGEEIPAVGRVHGLVSVDRFHPVVSLISQIFPSPDWFIGLDSVPLCSSRQFLERASYRLLPWDSGTDNGLTFTAADSPSLPHQVVTPIRSSNVPAGSVFRDGTDELFATVTFQRVETLLDTLNDQVTEDLCPSCNSSFICLRSNDVSTSESLLSTVAQEPCDSGFVSEANLAGYCVISALGGFAIGAVFVLLLCYCRQRRSKNYSTQNGSELARVSRVRSGESAATKTEAYQPMSF